MHELKVKSKFDPDKCRQYLNDELSVFHCHHYSTLFTQLADDAKLLKGSDHLRNAAIESMYPVMKKYCKENSLTSAEDKIEIAQQYFAYVGLGKLKLNLDSNSAEMTRSHIDEGWIKKWGKRDQPVNFIGQGFIAAAVALVNDDDPSLYKVEEKESIVAGASSSKFSFHKS